MQIALGSSRIGPVSCSYLGEPAPEPKPRPIAVIAAGVPIEDIMAKLAAIQAGHPGAQIRQGRRNCWEIRRPSSHPADGGRCRTRPLGQAHGVPCKRIAKPHDATGRAETMPTKPRAAAKQEFRPRQSCALRGRSGQVRALRCWTFMQAGRPDRQVEARAAGTAAGDGPASRRADPLTGAQAVTRAGEVGEIRRGRLGPPAS